MPDRSRARRWPRMPAMRSASLSRRAALVVATLALAACTSFIPPYERPAAPVPPTYPPDVMPASTPGAEAAADVDWQRFFADPRLKRLIELAIANNRDLRI